MRWLLNGEKGEKDIGCTLLSQLIYLHFPPYNNILDTEDMGESNEIQ